jgi:hypothetical protein
MLRSRSWTALLLLLIAGPTCDMLDPAVDTNTARYVVESYQIAGEPLGPVTLRTTTNLDTRFHSSETGVSGAAVIIQRLTGDGAIDTTVTFTEDPDLVGVYRPPGNTFVDPMTRYRLEITPPAGDEPITSETTIPDTFRVAGSSTDTIPYRTGEHLTIPTTASRYPDRQSIYLLDLQALDVREEQLTPTARELMDGVDTGLDRKEGYSLKDMRRAEWGPINEVTYRADKAGPVPVTVAWEKLAFFGPNRIDAYVIDDNLYEIIRSDAAQESSAHPGEIPPVVDHVDGGTGVFAGLARARYEVVVRRP